MDIVTHSLSGVLLSRLLPLPRTKTTTLLLIAASNIPDIDKYGAFTHNPTAYFEHHRGYAHALAFAPLLALLCLLAYRAVRPLTPMLAIATLAAILIHDGLDTLNPFGVRLLLPWSDTWIHYDLIGPWDLVFVGALTIACVIPSILAIVDSEVAGAKVKHPSPIAPIIALVIITGYTTARYFAHEKAITMMSEAEYRGVSPKNVYAFPLRTSITEWRGIAEGKDWIYELPIDINAGVPVRDQFRLEQPEHGSSLEAARTTHEFQVVERIARIPVYILRRPGDGQDVDLIDLRFGPSAEPQLDAHAHINQNFTVRSVTLWTGSLFWY